MWSHKSRPKCDAEGKQEDSDDGAKSAHGDFLRKKTALKTSTSAAGSICAKCLLNTVKPYTKIRTLSTIYSDAFTLTNTLADRLNIIIPMIFLLFMGTLGML